MLIAVGGAIGGLGGAVVLAVIAGAMNFASYWFSADIVLKSSGAHEIERAPTRVNCRGHRGDGLDYIFLFARGCVRAVLGVVDDVGHLGRYAWERGLQVAPRAVAVSDLPAIEARDRRGRESFKDQHRLVVGA